MKHLTSLFLLLPFIFAACTDNNEPQASTKDKIIGYWAVTHISEIEHIGGSHNTYDKDVPPEYLDNPSGDEIPRWNVLIFDEEFVTVRGDMPSCPKAKDYDTETTEGQLEYIIDWDNWNNAIGEYTDHNACPVGRYYIKDNALIIGTLEMGKINFVSDDMFTLDYKKNFTGSDDYRRLIYTYSRIYSLTK